MRLVTDISHWKDNPETPLMIDFEAMKDGGASAVIFKVSQGRKVDSVFTSSWGRAKGILPRGGFMYMDNRMSGLDQAKAYVDAIAADPPEGPSVVDFEDRENMSGKVDGHLWNALTYIRKATGKTPWIYTGPDYWENFGTAAISWRQFPLWIASYGTEKPTVPAPWFEARLWQFTAVGKGGLYGVESAGIDLNWYMKSDADFALDFPNAAPLPVTPLSVEQRLARLEDGARQAGWFTEP